ncbi:MAG: hypothetical protein IJH07_00850 [Ruminococcus sp.]|nr:hypothetical protein [Ruminococcus sp.]
MKAIKCEMCGSDNLVKQNDLYICQSCGTKYSTEEAKKLLVEIKVDKSDETAKLYQLARIAKKDFDAVSAAKYYEQIKVLCPDDWEAAFFSLYFRLYQCRIFQIQSSANTLNNSLSTVCQLVLLIKDDNKKVMVDAVLEILVYVQAFAKTMDESALKHLNECCTIRTSTDGFQNLMIEYGDRAIAIANMLHTAALLAKGFVELNTGERLKSQIVSCEKTAAKLLTNILGFVAPQYRSEYTNMLQEYKKVIREYEPSYILPSSDLSIFNNDIRIVLNKTNGRNSLSGESSNTSSTSNSSGGCYVATCVYGSYDCPQVWALRRYRDYYLAPKKFGRLFIRLYYAISPTLVRWFGKKEWFRRIWKNKLDKRIEILKQNGVKDSPYQDIEW